MRSTSDFAVADTGIGIQAEHLDSLFRDFVQVEAPIQKRLRGTGLGLSLSKKLARVLGGDVNVASELGVGSTFSVTIPLTIPGHAPASAMSAAERAMSTDPAVTVLVVDDNAATLYATSHVLRSVGLSVVEATTGRDALLKARQGADLVVLDINLPDMDGFQVCRELRAAPETRRTPVIYLSATFVDDIDKVHGVNAGADGI